MSVTIHQARDLALRFAGLYCVLRAFQGLPRAIYLSTWTPDRTYPGNLSTEVIGEFAACAFYVVAAYLLLRRTAFVIRFIWPAEEQDARLRSVIGAPAVRLWVQLIGVYFLIYSLAFIASVVWHWLPGFRSDSAMPYYNTNILIRYGVMLVLAVICIRHPDAPFRLFRPQSKTDDEVLES